MGRNTQQGFTLLELLVVVAVIALLVGILVPSLSRARETVRTTHCASGLRQWGMALGFYLNDYAQTLPHEGSATAATVGNPGSWFNALPPYVNALPYCDLYAGGAANVGNVTAAGPITANANSGYGNNWIWYCQTALQRHKNSGSGYNSFHYTMNAVINGTSTFTPDYGQLNPPQDYTKVAAIPELQNTPFLFESDSNMPCNSPTDNTAVARTRHSGQSLNILWLDCHIETVLGASVSTPPAPAISGNPWTTLTPRRITWGPFRGN